MKTTISNIGAFKAKADVSRSIAINGANNILWKAYKFHELINEKIELGLRSSDKHESVEYIKSLLNH